MIRSVLPILVLAILVSGVRAETFRCRDAQGVLVFTDDPDNFPPGCLSVEETRGEVSGGLNIVPAPSPSAAGAGFREGAVSYGEGERESRDWRKEAQALVEEYRDAQARRVPSLPQPTVLQAIGDMERIQRQAAELRSDLAGARLPAGDRAEIEQILSVIPPAQ